MSRDLTPCCKKGPYSSGRDRIDIYSCGNKNCDRYPYQNRTDSWIQRDWEKAEEDYYWCDVCGPEGNLSSDGMLPPLCPSCGERAKWQSTVK